MTNCWIKTRLSIHRLLTTKKGGYLIISLFFVIPIIIAYCIFRSKGSSLHSFYYLFNLNYPDSGHANHAILFFWIGVIGTIVISGLLMMLFTNGIQRWVERIREGRKVFKWISGHYVMIGYNRMSINIINRMNLDWRTQLVILTRKNPMQLRAELQSSLADDRKEKHIIIYAGGRDRIKNLNLDKAKEVYIIVENNEWESQYTRSMAILEEVAINAKQRHKDNQLRTNLYINEVAAYNIIAQLNLPIFDGIEKLDVHPFNLYDNWARLLWSYNGLKDENGKYVYDQLDFEPIKSPDNHVHLVIVGFNSMGRALWQEAVRIAHYPNFDEKTGKNQTIITVIDPRANEIETELLTQYPDYAKTIKDIKFEYKANRIEDNDIRQELIAWAQDKDEMLTVAVCFSDADKALSTALALPEKLFFDYNKLELVPKDKDEPDGKQILVKSYSRTRILVQQSVRHSIDKLLEANREKYVNMRFFGNFEDAFSMDLLDDYLAICVNGIYTGRGKDGKELDADFYNIEKLKALDINEHYADWEKSWLQTTSEQDKLSTRYQIDHYRSTLPIIAQGLGNELADRLAQSEHLRWIAERTLAGWRQVEYGEKRVNELKLHTDIIPYHQLSKDEKRKDSNVVLFAETLVKAKKESQKAK